MASSLFSRRRRSCAEARNRKRGKAAEARAQHITRPFDNLIDYMQARAVVASVLLCVGCARFKPAPAPESAYAPSGACGACHAEIADRYQHVAMSRSLYR